MTFVPGNKTIVVSVLACCIALALLFEAVLFERKAKLRFYEKSYSVAVEKLNENNEREKKAVR